MISTKKDWISLGIITAIALALRLWGIRFGLPYTYHIDEPFFISGALNLGTGIVGKQDAVPGLVNILFGEYGTFYVVGRMLKLFSSLSSFEQFYRSDPTAFYLLGRLTSALLGALTTLTVFGLGKQIFDHRVGLVGAVLLAGAFLHVRDSHYAVPDVTATFLVATSVLAAVMTLKKNSTLYLLISAGLGGIALATKWTMWPVVVPSGLAVYYLAQQRTPERTVGNWLRLAILAGLMFLISFGLFSFEIFVNPTAYLDYARTEIANGAQGGFSIWQVDNLPGWIFYLKTLGYGTGWALLAFATGGAVGLIVAAFRRRESTLITFLVFPLVYLLFMGSTRHYFARYALPLIPFLALSAAWAADRLAVRLSAKPTGQSAALAGLTLLMVIQPLVYSLRYDQLMTRVDTRTQAKQWIEANLPVGAKIAIDWYYHTPLLASPSLDIPIPNSKRAYNVIEPGFMGLYRDGPAGQYRDEGYDYLIASSYLYNVSLINQEKQRQRGQFYADLDTEYRLVKAFYPNENQTEPTFTFDEIYGPVTSLWQREQPGPVIKIYAVNPPNMP